MAALATGAEAPIALGNRRELFVDSFLIETLTNAELRLGAPVPTRPCQFVSVNSLLNPVVRFKIAVT
jgi:hypothetical protein